MSERPDAAPPKEVECICEETSRVPGHQVTLRCVADCEVHKVRYHCDECGKEDCACNAMTMPTMAPDGIIKFVRTPEVEPVKELMNNEPVAWFCRKKGDSKGPKHVLSPDEFEEYGEPHGAQPLYASLPEERTPEERT